jgi:hypothetical protein
MTGLTVYELDPESWPTREVCAYFGLATTWPKCWNTALSTSLFSPASAAACRPLGRVDTDMVAFGSRRRTGPALVLQAGRYHRTPTTFTTEAFNDSVTNEIGYGLTAKADVARACPYLGFLWRTVCGTSSASQNCRSRGCRPLGPGRNGAQSGVCLGCAPRPALH